VLIGRAGWWAVASISSVLWIAAAAPSFAAIHPGDTLDVQVWNHPELSKKVTVDADGSIRVPLSGVVPVAGLDEPAAARMLTVALRPYVLYPAVEVETIEQGKTIFIAGGPVGQLAYKPGETLTAAVTDAMAPSSAAESLSQNLNAAGESVTRVDGTNAAIRARIDLHAVSVQREGTTLGAYDIVALNARGEAGPLLEPGDTIAFAYKPMAVRVQGDVARPGPAYLGSDQSLDEAISQAGGLLPTAATNHVLLTRGDATQSLALGDPMFRAPAQTGDVITVPRAPRVNVLGPVVTPGVVALKTDSTLLSALYTAGGPTKYANLHNVQIVRAGRTTAFDVTKLTHGDMSQNPELRDGDTVLVPEGHYFDVTNIFTILGGIAAGLANRVTL
jgi:protein involved in polysaccharide export with SLBB domain